MYHDLQMAVGITVSWGCVLGGRRGSGSQQMCWADDLKRSVSGFGWVRAIGRRPMPKARRQIAHAEEEAFTLLYIIRVYKSWRFGTQQYLQRELN